MNISERDIKMIEKDTRKQSKGASFYHHRVGRIGASISKLACHTNPAQPSQSLIKTICYPTFTNLVQLPQSMDASMKTQPELLNVACSLINNSPGFMQSLIFYLGANAEK